MKIAQYPRGFLIFSTEYSDKDFSLPESYSFKNINKHWRLAYDTRTDIVVASIGNKSIVLIGKPCDIDNLHISIEDIAYILLTHYIVKPSIVSNTNFLNYLDGITGRYCFFIIDDDKLFAMNDLGGYKSIYYHTQYKILASHYNIIHSYTRDEPLDLDFFSLDDEYRSRKLSPPWVLPANVTPYKNIYLLIPNHYYESVNRYLIRYYPYRHIKMNDIESASVYLTDKIKGVFVHYANKHKILQGLTFGFDSRLSLAASREVRDKITYFTFHSSKIEPTSRNWRDMENNFQFATKMASKLGLNHISFDIQNASPIYEQNKKEEFVKNHYLCSNPLLTISLLQQNFEEEYVHLKSVNECIRVSYFNVDPTNEFEILKRFTHWAGYKEGMPSYPLASRLFHIWMNWIGLFKLMKNFPEYLYGDLFFLEYRMAQWMAAVALETDPAMDTIIPINCRKFLDAALSVPKELKDNNVLACNIIKSLWPELLEDFMYPNKYRPLFNYIDFNADSRIGYFHFYDSLFEKENFDIKYGNDLTKKMPVAKPYYEIFNEGVSLSFTSSQIVKGDYCELLFKFPTEPDCHYYLSFLLETNRYYFQSENNFKIQVSVNSDLLYDLYTNTFTRPNMCVYSFKCQSLRECVLSVKLIANRDITTSAYNSFVKIDKLYFSREFIFKSENAKFTTTELYLKRHENTNNN